MEDIKGEALFVNINTDERKHRRIMELIGLKDFQLPTMRFMKFEGDATKSKSRKVYKTNSVITKNTTGNIDKGPITWTTLQSIEADEPKETLENVEIAKQMVEEKLPQSTVSKESASQLRITPNLARFMSTIEYF